MKVPPLLHKTMGKDWFLSSSGSGKLGATVGGSAALGGTFIADSVGIFDALGIGLATLLTAVNIPADPVALGQAFTGLAYLFSVAYGVFGFLRKGKNRIPAKK